MTTIQAVDVQENSPASLTVLLPGWADEASTIPHPAPLVEPMEMALCQELGVKLPNLHALPGALCLWRAASDHPPPPPAHLVCASPVHVIAGSDDAQLVSIARLNLSMDETQTMIAELNAALADSSCAFLYDEAGQWYHQGLPAAALEAAPPSAVEGHPMTLAMTRSDEARPWRSLWSETQMVMHQSAVNQARQARGEPLINSVWFWGGGPMPSLAPSPVTGNTASAATTVLYANDLFARGLADSLGIVCLPLEALEPLDLTRSDYRHHVIVDTELLHGNPDFVEQRDLGAQWCQRVAQLVASAEGVEAEINGLTGCREVFVPTAPAPPSLFSRLASVLKPSVLKR